LAVNTKKVKGRRTLKFRSYDELLADLDQLGATTAKPLGNWSEGQIYRHLALVFNGSMDGLPIRFPWYVRFMARLFKKFILKGSMPAGFQLSADAEKVIGPAPVSAEEGRAELRTAVGRLQIEPERDRHPVFGQITREEWDQVHLLHASLHLSFLVPV
jgi:hypothetical protein